jgi:hypothetical protein
MLWAHKKAIPSLRDVIYKRSLDSYEIYKIHFKFFAAHFRWTLTAGDPAIMANQSMAVQSAPLKTTTTIIATKLNLQAQQESTVEWTWQD